MDEYDSENTEPEKIHETVATGIKNLNDGVENHKDEKDRLF